MSNELAVIQPAQMAFGEVAQVGKVIAASGLFGIKTPEQAVALCLIAQAEGKHPATAAQEYNIIQGRPALKADAMLARFQAAGGRVQWTEVSDTRCAAVFSHPQGGKIEIDWDMKRAKQAQLGGKDIWTKYPRQMLRARVISEGVRTVYPGVLGGMYTPEEVQEFEPLPAPKPTAKQAAEVFEAEIVEPEPEVVPASAWDTELADYQVIGGGVHKSGDNLILRYLLERDGIKGEAVYTNFGQAINRSCSETPQDYRGIIQCRVKDTGKGYGIISELAYPDCPSPLEAK